MTYNVTHRISPTGHRPRTDITQSKSGGADVQDERKTANSLADKVQAPRDQPVERDPDALSPSASPSTKAQGPMTTAPARPPVHFYDPGKNPMELVGTPSGKMERWRADALLVGETSALARVRDDSIAMISNISAREDALAGRRN
jgi:hypothetical protein